MKNRFKSTALVLGAIALVIAGAWFGQSAMPQLGAISVSAEAQPTSTTATLPRTVTVVGEGKVSLEPDIAQATIGIETTGATVKLATAEETEIMEAIIAALLEVGVETKDIQTSGYSVWAERDRDPSTGELRTPTYRVTNSVSVTVRDLDSVGDVLDAAIEAGANTIHGVTFGFDDAQAQESLARKKAAADALSRAQELAELHGLEVGEVLSISEVVTNGVYASNFRGAEYSAMSYGGGSSTISPGELDLSLRLQVVYALD